MLMAEEWDDGQIQTRSAVKVSRYINQFQAQGPALRHQPKPQLYFHRPLKDYLNSTFQTGFVLDAFDERAFPPEHPQFATLGWGGSSSEIPSCAHRASEPKIKFHPLRRGDPSMLFV